MPKYEYSKTIDYQMLDPKEVLGKKIIDFYLQKDEEEGDELIIFLEGGKQIEICGYKVHVQSD